MKSKAQVEFMQECLNNLFAEESTEKMITVSNVAMLAWVLDQSNDYAGSVEELYRNFKLAANEFEQEKK